MFLKVIKDKASYSVEEEKLKHNHCYLPICCCIFVDHGWIGGDRGGNQRSISSSIKDHPYITSAKELGK